VVEGVIRHLPPAARHAKEVAILGVLIVAGAVYPLLLFASGGLTLTELKAAVRRSGKA
jgi:putative peptidoglycan lipid II flippase